jgi:hypothetical protein
MALQLLSFHGSILRKVEVVCAPVSWVADGGSCVDYKEFSQYKPNSGVDTLSPIKQSNTEGRKRRDVSSFPVL